MALQDAIVAFAVVFMIGAAIWRILHDVEDAD